MPLYGAPGERIAYTIHDGPPGAPPVLLVHGLTTSSAAYIANVEGLRERFTVITMDLLGHGGSDAPEDSTAYGPGPAMARMAGLLDHLGIDRVLLVGHSLGGALSLRFALMAPDRVAGLVVINSSTAALTPELFAAARPRYAMMAERAREEGLGFLEDSGLNPAHSRWLPDHARAALLHAFQRMTPAGFAGTTEGLTAAVNSWDLIPSLEVPTLVVIGDRDEGFLRVAPAFLERLPAGQTSWVTLEGAGHAANLSRPEAFNEALIAFAGDIGFLPVATAETQPRRGGGINGSLTMLGSALIVAGFAMLGAAFLFRGDGANPARVEPPGAMTPTPFEQVSGAITPGRGEIAVPTPRSPLISTPVPGATQAPAAQATPEPPQPTSAGPGETPAAADPTEEPTEAPTVAGPTEQPTPSEPTPPAGPSVVLSGPSEVTFGGYGIFVAAASIEPLRWEWSGCNQGLPASSCSRFFTEFSCQTVSVTATMPDGTRLTRSQTVAVGGVICQ